MAASLHAVRPPLAYGRDKLEAAMVATGTAVLSNPPLDDMYECV